MIFINESSFKLKIAQNYSKLGNGKRVALVSYTLSLFLAVAKIFALVTII